ncbi:MAG: transcriptional regulator [Thermoplasmatota archaeon]
MDKTIHEPARLRIMAHLYKARDASFTALRDAAELTDGNFATHAARLQVAGFVESRRVFEGGRFVQRFQITKEGSKAFRGYLAELRALLDASD